LSFCFLFMISQDLIMIYYGIFVFSFDFTYDVIMGVLQFHFILYDCLMIDL
jgi:hypothetical protein